MSSRDSLLCPFSRSLCSNSPAEVNFIHDTKKISVYVHKSCLVITILLGTKDRREMENYKCSLWRQFSCRSVELGTLSISKFYIVGLMERN